VSDRKRREIERRSRKKSRHDAHLLDSQQQQDRPQDYPPESNTFVKTYQRWGTQVGLDGIFNILKEFWPDIDHAVFHGKY
jgi:hypothetical protein